MNSILKIDSLSYRIGDRMIFNVKDLAMKEGEIIHLVGDSGVGKSLFGLSLIGFYSNQAHVDYDLEIGNQDQADWRSIREKEIGYIFQQPRAYFNPALTCGQQLLELMPDEQHSDSKKQTINEFCDKLELDVHERIFTAYPHEFSIGQLQRMYVISSLIRKPKMIIADEPFAHLDWPTAKLVASELVSYVRNYNAALLLISHERPGSLIIPDRIWNFEHPTIVSRPFHRDNLKAPKNNRRVSSSLDLKPVIEARHVSKSFRTNTFSIKGQSNEILQNISLSIKEGGRIGLMGGSGSGKSTLANILSGLLRPTSGELFGVHQVEFSLASFFRRNASPVQVVFQDPYTSFNPTQKILAQISNKSNRNRVEDLVLKMALNLTDMDRTPMELSGGELQRFSIIRALCVQPKPKMLILDEALSALDLETQVKILELFDADYRELAILFISHRFERLKTLCSEIFFLHDGKLIYHLADLSMDHQKLPDHVRRLIS